MISHSAVGIARLLDRVLLERAPYHDPHLLGVLIREAMFQAGLGTTNVEAPLMDLVEPGMTVLLKPNWVLHRNEGNAGMDCMVTHPEFILAALIELLKAKPARVILGDAPIQGCIWDKLVTCEFKQRVLSLAKKAGVSICFIDFRRIITVDGDIEKGIKAQASPMDRYCMFDLGKDSLLEPLSKGDGRFRLTNYDPDKLAQAHCPGRHEYLLCREAFECDLIISLPKLKLHRKAGITGALKNLVGLNGNKDYLPHHRVGGTSDGGDCYPGRSASKRLTEFMLDQANRRIGTNTYVKWLHWAHWLLKRVATLKDGGVEGSWHGNDTCWRMVLDLNRILLYGRADSSMADTKQRTLWTLTDAILCGQGEGPLAPSPVTVGTATFSPSAPVADAVHCALLGVDEMKIALVRESFGSFRWPLVPAGSIPEARFMDRTLTLDAVAAELGVHACPPAGWKGYIER